LVKAGPLRKKKVGGGSQNEFKEITQKGRGMGGKKERGKKKKINAYRKQKTTGVCSIEKGVKKSQQKQPRKEDSKKTITRIKDEKKQRVALRGKRLITRGKTVGSPSGREKKKPQKKENLGPAAE